MGQKIQLEEAGSGHVNICNLKHNESNCWHRMLGKDREITSQEILWCGQTKGRSARVLWVVNDAWGAFTNIPDVQQKKSVLWFCAQRGQEWEYGYVVMGQRCRRWLEEVSNSHLSEKGEWNVYLCNVFRSAVKEINDCSTSSPFTSTISRGAH